MSRWRVDIFVRSIEKWLRKLVHRKQHKTEKKCFDIGRDTRCALPSTDHQKNIPPLSVSMEYLNVYRNLSTFKFSQKQKHSEARTYFIYFPICLPRVKWLLMTGGFHLIDTRHPSIFNCRRVNNFHKKEPPQNYRHVLYIFSIQKNGERRFNENACAGGRLSAFTRYKAPLK